MAGRAERAYAFSPAPNTSLAPPQLNLLVIVISDIYRLLLLAIEFLYELLLMSGCLRVYIWLILGSFNSKFDKVFYSSFATIEIFKYRELYRDELSMLHCIMYCFVVIIQIVDRILIEKLYNKIINYYIIMIIIMYNYIM